ncbi:hypothetical protein LP420_09030 [Massilia sp. B-10]|nr:hypothetical protein LP420_09030 [Massilia sp. B-10]UUZ55607.1 hypothetical protein LP419_08465 [Massilia sp. H-1]
MAAWRRIDGALAHAVRGLSIDDYDELRRSLVKAVEAGVTGKQDAQLALDQAAAIWNKKLAAQRLH